MILQIPIPLDASNQTVPAFDLIVPLEGTNYTLSFRWSARPACWFFDVSEADGTPIIAGLVVRVATPLIIPSEFTQAPPGVFFAVDSVGTKQDPGQFDFGVRVSFIYVTSDQRTALGL